MHNTEKSVRANKIVLLQADNYQYNYAYLSFSCISSYKITFLSLLPMLSHQTTAVWYSKTIGSFSILTNTPSNWMKVYTCYLHPELSIVQKCLTALTVHVRVWLNSEPFSVTVNKVTQIWIMQGERQLNKAEFWKVNFIEKTMGENFFNVVCLSKQFFVS
jgi:hypothetical protein